MEYIYNSLKIAIRNEEIKKFRNYLQKIDIEILNNKKDDYGNTIFHIACKKGNLEMIKLLIEKGIDLNTQNDSGNTSLHYACNKGNLEIVKLLIKKKVNIHIPNNNGNTAIYYCYNVENLEIILLSNKKKFDFDEENNVYLNFEIFSENIHSNIQDDNGFLFTKKLEIIKLLMANGAKINKKNIENEKILHKIIRYQLALKILVISKIILLSKEKGYFSTLIFELIVYIFYFIQDYPYQYFTYQQIKEIAKHALKKDTLDKITFL